MTLLEVVMVATVTYKWSPIANVRSTQYQTKQVPFRLNSTGKDLFCSNLFKSAPTQSNSFSFYAEF